MYCKNIENLTEFDREVYTNIYIIVWQIVSTVNCKILIIPLIPQLIHHPSRAWIEIKLTLHEVQNRAKRSGIEMTLS